MKCHPSPVQRGIYYCNEVEFMAFDLKVFIDNDNYFEGYDERAKLFDAVNIPYLKPMVRGELKKCLDFSIGFNSTIPAILKMPPLEDESPRSIRNLTEGIVIVHIGRFYCTKAHRSMVKIKNKKFCEINKGTSEYVTQKKRNFITNKHNFGSKEEWKTRMEIINKAMPTILTYITENRYNNVKSHEWKEGKEVAKPYVDDVLKDYSQDYQETWKTFDEESMNIIKKRVERKFLKKLSEW